MRSGHIVLLGDSIFDNGAWVHQDRGDKPVINQLQALLPDGWTATLAAVDGHVTRDVCSQLRRVPRDASHLVVSVGGNDALSHSHLLLAPAESTVEALTKVAGVREQFRRDYRAMLNGVCALGKPTLVCTIYDGISLGTRGVPAGRDNMLAALATFNDVIIDEAVRSRLPILDLRRICDEDADYSDISPIEPSAAGGAKIARAIWRIVAEHDFRIRRTVVFGTELLEPAQIATPFGVFKELVGECREEWFMPEGWAEDRYGPCWPIAPLSAEWVWRAEPHPQVGEIVGWSWERQQVAVVTVLDDGPRLIIELRPMREDGRRARVVDVATGKEHESVLWYERWHRVGEKTVDGERVVFEGRCSVLV